MLSDNPGKRWVERFVLGYSAAWIAVVVLVMATRAIAGWGDVAYLLLGVGLAAPPWLALGFAPREARGPLLRFNLWIGLFSFLQNYYGAQLFFDVLGMEYRFPVHWIWNRTPLFLYFMTVAYFSTYYVLMSLLWRAVRRRFPSLAMRVVALLVLAYGVAFAETATMANEWIRDYFWYRDKSFTLIYGSIAYGTIFVLSLPFVYRLDEEPNAPPAPLSRVVLEVLAINMLALVCYELYRHVLA